MIKNRVKMKKITPESWTPYHDSVIENFLADSNIIIIVAYIDSVSNILLVIIIYSNVINSFVIWLFSLIF